MSALTPCEEAEETPRHSGEAGQETPGRNQSAKMNDTSVRENEPRMGRGEEEAAAAAALSLREKQ